MQTDYIRVIPRDLFNEAKLLKCIGRLVLLIHDGKALNGMYFSHDDDPFSIALLDEGSLTITNIEFVIPNAHDAAILFKTTYNSKSSYPLYCEHKYCDTLVFDEQGEYTQEFIDLCNTLAAKRSAKFIRTANKELKRIKKFGI